MGKIHMAVRSILYNEIDQNNLQLTDPFDEQMPNHAATDSTECPLAFIEKHYQNVVPKPKDEKQDLNTEGVSFTEGMTFGNGLG